MKYSVLVSDKNPLNVLMAEKFVDLGFRVIEAKSAGFHEHAGKWVVEGLEFVGRDKERKDKTISVVDDVEIIRTRATLPIGVNEIAHTINTQRLRKISSDKWAQYALLSDWMPKTVIYDGQNIGEVAGEKIVVKANDSFGKKMVKIDKRARALEMIGEISTCITNSRQSDESIILQEYIRGDSWPELIGRDSIDDERLHETPGREVRVYVFAYRDAVEMYAVGRLVDGDRGEWIILDQESVPEEAWEVTRAASRLILAEADEKWGYIAVDLIKNGEKILIREVNTRDPQLVIEDEDFATAELLGDMMARLGERIVTGERR